MRIRRAILLPVLCSALLSGGALRCAAEAAEDACHRPPPPELAAWKEAWTPDTFDWERFGWEVADVAVLAGVLLLASVLSLKKARPCRFTALTLVAGLLYFGIFRGGCICPVGATTNFCLGLVRPELIGKIVAVLFFLPLVTAFFAGRVFCSSACPLGAVQHLLSRRRKAVQLPPRLNRLLRLLPFFFLAALVWGALRGGVFLACRLDPYKPLFFTGHAWTKELVRLAHGATVEGRWIWVGDALAWGTLAGVLVLGWFVPRPFCRFVCPYGVLLGFFSRFGLRRRHIDPESCFTCVMCTRTCPVQAITADREKGEVKVDDFHCIQCGRCDNTCTNAAFRNFSFNRPDSAGEKAAE